MPKRTNAIKISDLKSEKPWLRKKQPSNYDIGTKIAAQTILIVCEGQTEKLYLESFPVLSLSVEIVNLKGESKLKLVNEAIELNKVGKYDVVWCVFDMDVNSGEKEFSDFDNSIFKAKSVGFQVAYSNDAFELWFCLHYKYIQQANHRKYYYQMLSDLWDINYEKKGKAFRFCLDLYERLNTDVRASRENAHLFSEKLHLIHQDKDYHKQNPVTTVYLLVQYLEENSR